MKLLALSAWLVLACSGSASIVGGGNDSHLGRTYTVGVQGGG